MTFKEYGGLDLVAVADGVLKDWKKDRAFEKSLELREGAPEFIFFEGPPSANGMPGIHHVMARSIKDAVCRYKTQTGFKVRRRAGWDTHGLPVELGVEKKLGITKEDIGRKISVEEYNRACRREVMKYTAEWRTLTERIGYWVDMDDPYITYDNRYIETLWWLLKDIYGKGLLYKGKSIQPYSPAAGTGLSSHELNQPGCYRDVKDTTCTVQFKAVGEDDLYFLAWTTTPWTLPSNTALCVGPNIDYVRVKSSNPYTGDPATYIVARDLVHTLFNEKIPYEVVGSCKGSDLVGMRYEQLIPWFRPDEGAFRVIAGDYVSTEEGTGIVHIAPTFGADDARVARAAGVPALTVIDRDGNPQAQVDLKGRFFRLEDLDPAYVAGRVSDDYREWAGRFVKNAYDDSLPADAPTLDVDLCVMLKKQGKAFRIEKHVHSYPHCWRTDKPVLYYPLNSWFIRTTAVREKMMELNARISWKPESTGTGRFGKWLENIQDWNLSRSRYWGTPLPIWRTEDGKEELCIGSAAELYAEIDKAVAAGIMQSNPLREAGFDPADMSKENYDRIDLHRPYVDNIFLVSPSGRKMTRETDLIDVWFDSGAMPYAQTGLQWIPSSPHIPHPHSAYFYPLSGIVGELPYLSIGVGYTIPFQMFAAQWIDAEKLADRMNALELPGIKFRPIHLKPFYAFGQGEHLQGVQVHILDCRKARLSEVQFYILQELAAMYPDKKAVGPETEKRFDMFDKVCGSNQIRERFSKNYRFDDIKDYWYKDVESFKKLSRKYYLYK